MRCCTVLDSLVKTDNYRPSRRGSDSGREGRSSKAEWGCAMKVRTGYRLGLRIKL